MILYVNNFRGFKDTIIPIKDVNFLVGENSTGKTSILKLIKLLSGQQREAILDFSAHDINFHLFNDLQQESNGKRKNIEIGLLNSDSNHEVKSAILFTLFSKNNITNIKTIRYVNLPKFINTELDFGDKNVIKSRSKELDNKYTLNDDFFKINELNTVEFDSLINISPGTENLLPISLILSLAQNRASIETKRTTTFSLPIPMLPELIWSAPIRSEPLRTYDNYFPAFKSDGSHVPYILRDLLSKSNKKSKQFIQYLNSFGKASGLYDEIQIREYGEENTSPFEIDILLNKVPVNLINVGYGVSQILPILIEILVRFDNQSFAIQQPEIHLHPKGQAALGEFFYNSWREQKKCFFIETHSDYLIDRFRIAMNKDKRNRKRQIDSAQVLFFERNESGNTVLPIAIHADGKYDIDTPTAFRDFFIKEELDLISLY